jgi:glycosyltransferase involved in cell wall biosynthesis
MKIIQIGSFPLNISCIQGGVEASVWGLSSELSKDHFVVARDIPRLVIKSDYNEQIAGITVFRFFSSGKNNYAALSRLKLVFRKIKLDKPDICHIHSTSLFSFVIYLFLRFYRIPALVTVHGLAHIEKKKSWKKQKSIRNGLKYLIQSLTEFVFLSICPIIIVDTQYVADSIQTYKKQLKITRLPVCKVVPQGISSTFFGLDCIPQEYNLLSIGAFTKRKGHLQLIAALQKVKENYPDIKLTIAGALSDVNYYMELKTYILACNLEENVTLCADIDFEEILRLYQQAELFVLHTEEESQGIVFCEAMAVGKAIVATNVGGVPWVVENNVNGLLSDFGDIDTFAQNILKLIHDNSLRSEIEETNKRQSHTYDWQLIAKEILNLYKEIIN